MNEPGNEMWVGMFWGAVIVLPIAGIVALVYFLAITDTIFTFVKEGEIKAVMIGESLVKFLVNVSGYRYYHPTDSDHPANAGKNIEDVVDDYARLFPQSPKTSIKLVREHVIVKFDEEKDKYRNWFNRLGLYYIGWLPGYFKLLWYKFFWQKWQQVGQDQGLNDPTPNKEEGKYFVKPRQETVGSLFFQTVYPITATDVDLKENVTVKIITLVTVRVVYPMRTLFRILPIGNWFGFLHSSVISAIRDFGGDQTFEKIRKEKHEATESAFEKAVMGVNPQLLEQIGVIVIGVDFQRVEFQNPELHRRYQEAGVAEQVGKALQRKAKGQAAGIRTIAKAEKERLDQTIPSDGPAISNIVRGIVLATEALSNAKSQKETPDQNKKQKDKSKKGESQEQE